MKNLRSFGLLTAILALVFGFTLISCNDTDSDRYEPLVVRGTAGGRAAELEISTTRSVARSAENPILTPATGDSFVLRYTDVTPPVVISRGRIEVSGIYIIFIPSSGERFTGSYSGQLSQLSIPLDTRLTLTFTPAGLTSGGGNGGGGGGTRRISTYTVRFDADGGSPTPANQTVTSGGKVTPVTEPTKQDWNFLYWANAANNNEWNFATNTVTANITLKAIWTEDPVFIVSFNTGTGGSTVQSQNVKEGENAHDPGVIPTTTATSSTLPTTAGLYRGKGAPDVEMAQVFVEWRAPGATSAFVFDNTPITANIELIAQWTTTRIASVTANDVAAAVTYINANQNEYTLLLGANPPSTEQQTLNGANNKLTIIGLGAERTIQVLSSGISSRRYLFTLNNGASLTLGNNITLQGITIDLQPFDPLIIVSNGSLTMLPGSKISGQTITNTGSGRTGAVIVGANSYFTMLGGDITGNSVGGTGNNSGGVRVSATATFTMSDGTISGNTNGDGPMDVYFESFNAANHTKTGGTIGASTRPGFEGTGPGT